MKRIWIVTALVCLAVILAFAAIYTPWDYSLREGVVKVGFIYENDESALYTHNFATVQGALERAYGERVKLISRSNVPVLETEEPLRELADAGCAIIFAYTHSEQIANVAPDYPDTQFCQVSRTNTAGVPYPDNYHTFNAEIYQGRYVSGIAAGMKLRELIDTKQIAPDQALVGFVGAYENPEVISAYTAFLLGVRSVAPEAVMRVRYTDAWCSYSREMTCAETLIDEGCVIIGQHTHTLGPAMACEEAALHGALVYHVGQDQGLVDVIPTASLISARINWTPCVMAMVDAVMYRRPIERGFPANIHGSDVSAGFERDWVQMLELNSLNAAPGTQEAVGRAVEAFRQGKLEVFKGPYTGKDPNDPSDTCDLTHNYEENARSSSPTFHYILDDVVIVER